MEIGSRARGEGGEVCLASAGRQGRPGKSARTRWSRRWVTATAGWALRTTEGGLLRDGGSPSHLPGGLTERRSERAALRRVNLRSQVQPLAELGGGITTSQISPSQRPVGREKAIDETEPWPDAPPDQSGEGPR